MAVRKLAVFLVMMSLLAPSLAAQTNTGAAAAKEKQKELQELQAEMLERTIAEAGGLRLAQNRAVVYALAGDIAWASDAKRARELFRTGASELMNHQAEVERDRLAAGPNTTESFDPSDPRFDFFNLVGSRDAELGLELMQQTRPAAIAEAMAQVFQVQVSAAVGAGQPRSTAGIPPAPLSPAAAMEQTRARQELMLEEQFKMRIAMNDPEKTVKAIKESLAKGISPSVTSMLQSLMQKDEKLATDMGAEVVGKLTGADLAKTQSDLSGAIAILQFMGRTPPPANLNVKIKYFAFSPAQAKESAYAVANVFLQSSPPAFVNQQLSRAIPIIEKLAPEKGLLLKQRDAQNKKSTTAGSGAPKPGATPAGRAFDPNGTPEEILAAAAKMSNPRDRGPAYSVVANRIGTITEEARARRVANSIPDERYRAQAIATLDRNKMNRLTSEGNLDEARRQVAAMGDKRNQLRWLVNLAIQYRTKNTEKDTETAAGLMTEARGLTNQFPEDEEDLADYMELVRGYAVVEPDTAFRMFDPMVSEFDDLIQASATLSKFNKRDRAFKKGEMVMRIGGGGTLLPFRYVMQVQSLARADLEKTSTLIDRFRRSDARLIMRLYVLQGAQRRAFVVQPPPPPAFSAD